MKTKKTKERVQTVDTETTSRPRAFRRLDPRELALRLLSHEAGWDLLLGSADDRPRCTRVVMLPRVYEQIMVPGPETLQ